MNDDMLTIEELTQLCLDQAVLAYDKMAAMEGYSEEDDEEAMMWYLKRIAEPDMLEHRRIKYNRTSLRRELIRKEGDVIGEWVFNYYYLNKQTGSEELLRDMRLQVTKEV